ncbi:valine--tRNA ligase [Candidatus Saccharibacteria bacterium]|nr:valine--tRNA ligase [Candidatus Saccharibacteria bacterium]MCL1963166.1 valine--tRNA ligase [Candidatus Saccharibacteria bacterium]
MQLPKTYEPNRYETDIYAMWEAAGAFKPSGAGDPYSIVMPPPNANANLHVGHSLEVIKDILIRYYRMSGRDAVYIPGADHAGFETWVVFEKSLESEGKSRFDFPREQLYQMVWDFVAKNRSNMELQIRSLGISCDWSTNTFTLDSKVVNIVYSTFKKMWDDGLIYRGERLVNYCTRHQTSFADIEVVYDEEETPLYYIKYGPFELATTRPETKFGDTAVAVHPDDDRYREWVGQTVTIHGVNGDFNVVVVADEMVDPHFGTGVVKITPAHSFDDWEVAQRHDLPAVRVIDPDGKLNDKTGRFAGMTILDGRKAVVEAMQEMGLILKIDEHYKTRIGRCYKCGTMIEPMLMKQWFINVKPLAERAKSAIENGDIKFVPEQKSRELVHYLTELRDWNISRQIPWGIPIPAFQNVDDGDDWIFDTRVDQTEIEVEGHIYRRDSDTFDTWFSSGQWPFITTDYLDSGELARFYPNSVMETGTDLLRPWVARMIMLGLYRTDQMPFKEVYLHGMVTDEKGRKMSKSKGNVINPMDFVAEFGSDALRMGISMNRSAGQPQAFSHATVIAGRNFCNKLWNMARLVQKIIDENPNQAEISDDLAAQWVKKQLNQAQRTIADHIENYRFAEAIDTVYHTIWDDVADWFIEAEKLTKNVPVLMEIMDYVLKIAHPFAPFVTEAIWTTFHSDGSLLVSQQWVNDLTYHDDEAEEFESIQSLVNEIRLVTTQLPAGKYDLLYIGDEIIADNVDLITTLAGLKSVQQVTAGRGLRIASTDREAWLDLSYEMVYEHQTRLEKRLAETRADIAKLESRLGNQGYIDRAPTHLVEESRQDLTDKQALVERLVAELEITK